MTFSPVFYGSVREGKLVLEDREDYKAYIKKFEGKEVVVVVKRDSDIRTLAENAYYWGVIVRMVADECALIPDEAHELLKGLFLKVGVEIKGRRYEVIKSSASLSIPEFEKYCEDARRWALSELNMTIPMPGEVIID